LHPGSIIFVEFLPTGQFLSVCSEGEIKVWNL